MTIRKQVIHWLMHGMQHITAQERGPLDIMPASLGATAATVYLSRCRTTRRQHHSKCAPSLSKAKRQRQGGSLIYREMQNKWATHQTHRMDATLTVASEMASARPAISEATRWRRNFTQGTIQGSSRATLTISVKHSRFPQVEVRFEWRAICESENGPQGAFRVKGRVEERLWIRGLNIIACARWSALAEIYKNFTVVRFVQVA